MFSSQVPATSIRESHWKGGLLALILVTVAAPLFFVDYAEPGARLSIVKGLAKAGSLAGTILLFWQFLLGFRGLVAKLAVDFIWIIELHKRLGAYGTILILLHPVFITVYYVLKMDVMPLTLRFGDRFDAWVMLGQITLAIILLVVLTSVWFRSSMSFRVWRGLHLTSYFILPLGIAHALPIGQTLIETPLRFVWYGLAAMAVILYLYRVLVRVGLFVRTYEVVNARPVAHEVVEIKMKPISRRMEPLIAQFVYFRRRPLASVHPYTVSGYDEQSGALWITVKALGKTSRELQGIRRGERVQLDGPYGVFTREARQAGRALVMIAGGIGITPFIRLADKLERDRDRDGFLFYANRYKKDIAYDDELRRLRHVRVVHVLSDEEHFEGEKGFVTLELLRKYLPGDLRAYEFLICGPEPMTVKLEADLRGAGVDDSQIHHELFTY